MSTYINPTPESFEAFMATQRDGPIQMLNLVKFKVQANYEDGTLSSGAAAYATYIKHTGPFVAKVGAKVIWNGKPEVTLIGPKDTENWDAVFIVEYPHMNAFVTMIHDPGYKAISHHRTAAVENSRLIRLEPLDI